MKLAVTFTIVLCSFSVNSYKVVCYFPNWATYRPEPGKFQVDDVDPHHCTHLIYAFATLNAATFVMEPFDKWLDIDLKNYQRFNQLKAANPKLKTLIALGGWNDSQNQKYSQLVADSSKIDHFVQEAVRFLKLHQFDGLDLDWEYPSGPEDKKGFADLVRSLRQAFDSEGFLLTVATSPSIDIADIGYDVPVISECVDFINMMTYDYHGSWESFVDHHSPLYRRSFQADGLDINSTVRYWLEHGAPAGKLILGIPIYGQSFKLKIPDVAAPLAPAVGPGTKGPYTGQEGFLSFYEICLKIKSNWFVVQDPSRSMGPYAYGDGDWVGFDDVDMALVKVNFIKTNHLGGAMVWELSNDDFGNLCGNGQRPFMTAIAEQLITNPILSTEIGTSLDPTTNLPSFPTSESTLKPTAQTTGSPTSESTLNPTAQTTGSPTSESTLKPTAQTTGSPTSESTLKPTAQTTGSPASESTAQTTRSPTSEPTRQSSSPATVPSTRASTSSAAAAGYSIFLLSLALLMF